MSCVSIVCNAHLIIMCISMCMRNFKELINAQNLEIINISIVCNVPGHIAYHIAIFNAVLYR